ncbi:helix-turn-helix domain-containing protein [Chloroflexota bacterium]
MDSIEGTKQEAIGTRLKRLRGLLVITQAELATKSSVPLPTIKNIERGFTSIPRVKTIRLLARVLKVSASYLKNGEIYHQ